MPRSPNRRNACASHPLTLTLTLTLLPPSDPLSASQPSAENGQTFQPRENSWLNPDHLRYFKFVGSVVGKALHDGFLLDAHFTRSFYKHILGVPVTYDDMEAIDPQHYRCARDSLALSLTLAIATRTLAHSFLAACAVCCFPVLGSARACHLCTFPRPLLSQPGSSLKWLLNADLDNDPLADFTFSVEKVGSRSSSRRSRAPKPRPSSKALRARGGAHRSPLHPSRLLYLPTRTTTLPTQNQTTKPIQTSKNLLRRSGLVRRSCAISSPAAATSR